jgi:transposase InsO family protein
LIHDRDLLFTAAFGEVLKAEELRIIPTMPQSPRMNAVCERVIGTLRRERLDWILILGESHLATVLGEYLFHYNGHRPHQSRHQRRVELNDLRSIRRKPVAAGMISKSRHAA